jgi:AcrR family transcriptional regulator
MVRTVKPPEVRRAEILNAANALFQTRGFADTTVEEIVRSAGVAKGTFYYYFRTKEDVLEAHARTLVEAMAERSRAIAQDPSLGPADKIAAMLAEQRRLAEVNSGVVDDLHRPENRELHDRSNIETVRILGPIFAEVVEEGKRAGIFDVKDALSTVQFVMAGSLFLFGEGVFDWTDEERVAREKAMLALIARAFGAKPGIFKG